MKNTDQDFRCPYNYARCRTTIDANHVFKYPDWVRRVGSSMDGIRQMFYCTRCGRSFDLRLPV